MLHTSDVRPGMLVYMPGFVHGELWTVIGVVSVGSYRERMITWLSSRGRVYTRSCTDYTLSSFTVVATLGHTC